MWHNTLCSMWQAPFITVWLVVHTLEKLLLVGKRKIYFLNKTMIIVSQSSVENKFCMISLMSTNVDRERNNISCKFHKVEVKPFCMCLVFSMLFCLVFFLSFSKFLNFLISLFLLGWFLLDFHLARYIYQKNRLTHADTTTIKPDNEWKRPIAVITFNRRNLPKNRQIENFLAVDRKHQ